MKKKRIIIILTVTVAIVTAAAFTLLNLEKDNRRKSGVISGNGTIEAIEVEISAGISGRLTMLSADEGDQVKAGQLVASLDDKGLIGQVEQAQGNLSAAEAVLAELMAGSRLEEIRRARATLEADQKVLDQARARLDLLRAGVRREVIDQLEAALRQAEVSLNEAEREYRRMTRLVEEGALPGQDLDRAETRKGLAEARVDEIRQRLAEAEAGPRPEELREAEGATAAAAARVKASRAALDLVMAGPRKESITAARARVEQSGGALKTARSMLEETKIFSPLAGRVIERNSQPGEVITPGFPILRLADLSTVFLRVYVPEREVGLVKLGRYADVVTDTYGGKKFSGRVVEIAQEPEFTPKNVQTKEERVKLVFGVKIEVDNPEEELKPGMPADAFIHIE